MLWNGLPGEGLGSLAMEGFNWEAEEQLSGMVQVGTILPRAGGWTG